MDKVVEVKKKKIREAVIVEGRYDKAKLSSLIDGIILETDGFAIFTDEEMQRAIRRMAEERGIIVMTDSDAAGFRIRSFITSLVGNRNVKHALVPDVMGKEKRKATASKEGKLGVEGLQKELLLRALEQAEATEPAADEQRGEPVTAADLLACGLTGSSGSAARRRALLMRLDLPQRTSTSMLLRIVNRMMTRREFLDLFEKNVWNIP